MIDRIAALDEALELWFNSWHTPWADEAMMIITDRWTWVPFYVILAALMVRRLGWRRALVMLVAIGVMITITDQLCATYIRPRLGRLRPCDVDNPLSASIVSVRDYAPQSYSLPSCHAANCFALATFLGLCMRRRAMTWLMFAWATVVCWSRLYLGVHHPFDILAGAAIGSAIACGIYWLTTKIRFGKRLAAAAATILIATACHAQKFEWGGEFGAVFDNREGDATYTRAETYFLTRLSPEIGVSFDKGKHRIMGGVDYVQPIGCEWDGRRFSPTLYYRYESRNFSGSMGMFPRRQLIRPLPEYLVSDSTRYFQNNLRGALLQYQSERGFFEFLCDWRGMQTTKRREAFAVILSGEYRYKLLRAGGTAMLNHLAKVKNAPDDQYVVDNIIANPYVGIDFMPLLKPWRHWKQLRLDAGPLGSLTRDRADGRWLQSAGIRSELTAEFWRLRLRNALWAGNRPLFPLYAKFGPALNEGEPFYAAKWYNRTEISGLLLRWKKAVELRAELDFHLAPNDFMFYQRILLTIKF